MVERESLGETVNHSVESSQEALPEPDVIAKLELEGEDPSEDLKNAIHYGQITKLKKIYENNGILEGGVVTSERYAQYEERALESALQLLENGFWSEEEMTEEIYEVIDLGD